MKIETVELTVPQRRLMEIFANTTSKGDYGDETARALLRYMRDRLLESGMSSPTLDALLNGTLPPLNFPRYFDMVMREVYHCSQKDGCGIVPAELPLPEYREMLLNCFPKIIYDLFHEPVASVDSKQNLLVTWIMWYGDKIKRELENVYDDELKLLLAITYEYIWTCTTGWPEFHQYFLSHWTKYLLTNEWPDKEAFYKEKWQTEKTLRESYQAVNEHLVGENKTLHSSLKERFITILDAARAVLRVIYGQDDVETEAGTLKKRIVRNNPTLTPAFSGKQGRIYFPVETLIPLFQADKKIGLTAGQIADAIRAKGKPREMLEA